MSCDKGYKGECCCECEHQLEIHVCGCGKCSKVTGYICKVFWEISKADGKDDRQVSHSDNKHGCCELFEIRSTW